MAPPDAYDVHDAQFIQVVANASAADALYANIGPVPAGKVWTILTGYITTSVAETRDFWFALRSASGNVFPINRPVSFALAPAVSEFFPALQEGMEIKLFPGEYIGAYRSAATAGSTISAVIRYIETDLQYYVELDKAKVLRRRQAAMIESEPATRGGMGSRVGMRGPLGGRERPTRY